MKPIKTLAMKSLSKFLIFLFVITQCTPAAGQIRPMVSGALIYAKMNESGIKLEDKIDPSFSIGIFAKKERFIGSLTTNRFTTFVATKDAISEKTGAKMISKSKSQSDVLSIGYAFNKFAPSILLSNTRINKQLEYQGQTLSNKTEKAILGGISGAYFLTKNFSVSVFYVLPNNHLNLEGAGGTAINLIF